MANISDSAVGTGTQSRRVSNTQTQETANRKDPHMIQLPKGFYPHGSFKDALWIRMQAIELRGMHTGGRGGTLQLGKKHTTFKFLAPEQIIESHNHTWDEYASIQSRILEKVIGFKTGIEQFKDVYSNLETTFQNAVKSGKGWPSGKRIIDILANVGDVRIPRYKIDTPLRYVSSQRRNYQLTFILADSNGGIDVTNAVKLLQKYAAPRSTSEISIDFPYIFSVSTEPEGLLRVNYAALESVMATWQTPYRYGFPQRCELTLSFKDMSPLFQSTIEKGSIINVNTPAREPTYDEEPEYIDRWRR